LSAGKPSAVDGRRGSDGAGGGRYVSAAHTDDLWAEIAMVLSQTHAKLLETQQSCLAMQQQQVIQTSLDWLCRKPTG